MKRPEQAIHQAVVAHLNARAESRTFFWHTPNEGKRGWVNAAALKAMGLVAGVPDLLILHGGKMYALELKAPGGRLTPSQRLVMERMSECGATVAAVFALDEAIITLECWGILRRDVQSGNNSGNSLSGKPGKSIEAA